MAQSDILSTLQAKLVRDFNLPAAPEPFFSGAITPAIAISGIDSPGAVYGINQWGCTKSVAPGAGTVVVNFSNLDAGCYDVLMSLTTDDAVAQEVDLRLRNSAGALIRRFAWMISGTLRTPLLSFNIEVPQSHGICVTAVSAFSAGAIFLVNLGVRKRLCG